MTFIQFWLNISFMVRSRFAGFCFMLIILVIMASSCASNKPPYRHYKPKKPAKCDCSRWAYHIPEKIFYLTKDEERPSGRA